MKNKLPVEFYRQADVVSIARQLLGKHIYTCINGELTGGIIVETEAYRGPEDRGSHAYNNKKTPRNEMMYKAGGFAYMYICYGIHDMLNIVTGEEGMSHAALIRAIEPVKRLDIMKSRRGLVGNDIRLCQGPGALAKSLGLTKFHNGTDLQGNLLWLTEEVVTYTEDQVVAAPRVGMNFEGPYKIIPWRFL